jgi:hypothetical protein
LASDVCVFMYNIKHNYVCFLNVCNYLVGMKEEINEVLCMYVMTISYNVYNDVCVTSNLQITLFTLFSSNLELVLSIKEKIKL